MNFIINPYHLLLFASLIGFLIVSILITKKNEISSFFLALFYSIISLFFLQTYIIDKGLFNELRWTYGWPSLFYSLIPFVIYAYFDSCINKKFQWKLLHILLFVPCILSLIDVVLFYLLPFEQREKIIYGVISSPNDRFSISYGFLTLQAHSIINYFFNIVSLGFIYPAVKRYSFADTEKTKERLFLQKWIFLLWGLFLFFSLTLLFWSININNFKTSLFLKNHYVDFQIIFSIISLLLVIVPIYNPKVLYDMDSAFLNVSKKRNKTISENSAIQDSSKYNLDSDAIKSKLSLLEENEKFTEPNFDLLFLSTELNIPIHQLSYFFKTFHGTSFSDYRNNLRIELAMNLIKSGFIKDKTFESLSMHCGFTSRSSFSKKFKSHTGMSLKEYAIKVSDSLDK